MEAWPFCAATWMGASRAAERRPTSSFGWRRSSRAASAWPWRAARCSGAHPFCFVGRLTSRSRLPSSSLRTHASQRLGMTFNGVIPSRWCSKHVWNAVDARGRVEREVKRKRNMCVMCHDS